MTGIENILIADIVNPATLPGAIFHALISFTPAVRLYS